MTSSMPDLGGGLVGNWSPGIGDPTFVGWFTVLAYFTGAYRCARAAQRLGPAAIGLALARRERRFWAILAVLLAALGVNKQLDLQSLFTELGRIAAYRGGWYEQRGKVQFAFILAAGLLGLFAVVVSARYVWHATFGARVAAAGAALLTTFVLIRAASFHHVDRFITSRWLGLKGNWLLELGGIAVVLGGTALQERALRRR
jgi:hypothetical protein